MSYPTDISFRPRQQIFVGKHDACWVNFARGDQEDSFAPLRQAKRKRIHDAICPPIATALEFVGDSPHCGAAIQLQHEGHVLDNNSGDAPPR
ncbi:hypothetical protein AC251_00035 [Ralstonia pseudosolanacearum]|nr:hypothetical protein AC251_00035 [Ralstonia pseudosolanacearum]